MSPYEWMDLGVLLADTFLKLTLVMVTSIIATRILRRKSPSAAHMVWVLALASAILIPLISVIGPGQPVLFLNLKPLRGDAPHQGQVTPVIAIPMPGAATVTPTPMISHDPLDWGLSPEVPALMRSRTLQCLTATWLLGFLAVISRCLVGVLGLRRIRQTGTTALPDGWMRETANELMSGNHIRRNVVFRLSTRDDFPIPMTWGVTKPVIVLPTESLHWSPAALRATLLHELAHIRRFDYFTQLVAEFACAINWFNPLVWMAARSLRSDAELAADEAVVQSGLKPSDYASELLRLAAGIGTRRIPYASLGTPAMTNSKIETRLESILSPSAGKRGVTSLQALTAVFCALVAVPTFAALHISTQTAVPSNADERTTALNRAKMMALATIMYASDYDDVYPYVRQSASLAKVAQPYAKTSEIFESPARGGKFLFNLNLAGVLTKVVPATTPMWIESVPDKTAKVAVAFADGHAKLISPADMGPIKKEAAKYFPREKTSKPLPYDYLLGKKP